MISHETLVGALAFFLIAYGGLNFAHIVFVEKVRDDNLKSGIKIIFGIAAIAVAVWMMS